VKINLILKDLLAVAILLLLALCLLELYIDFGVYFSHYCLFVCKYVVHLSTLWSCKNNIV